MLGIMRSMHDAVFKNKVSFETAKGEKTIAQIAIEFNVHTYMIRQWRCRLMERLPELFSNRRSQQETRQTSLFCLYLMRYPNIRASIHVKMTEIAEYLLLSLSNLTAIIDKLSAKKIVIRNRSEEDRRVVLVSLAEAGKKIAQKNHGQKHDLAKRSTTAWSRPMPLQKLAGVKYPNKITVQ